MACAAWPKDSDFTEKDDEFGTWHPQSILADCKYVCDPYGVIKRPDQKVYLPKLEKEETDVFRWECGIKLVQAGLLRVWDAPFPPLRPLPSGIVPVIAHCFATRGLACVYVRESFAKTVMDCLSVAGKENYGFGWAEEQYDPPFHAREFPRLVSVCELYAIEPTEEKKTGKTDHRVMIWRQLFNPELPFPAKKVEQLRKDMEQELSCRVAMMWEDNRATCSKCGRETYQIIIEDGEVYCHEWCLPLGARQRAFDKYPREHGWVQGAIKKGLLVTHRGLPV